ncbi:MAG: hypothetical protein M3186_16500 [Actinomycetota bacterium]|nr:hypothetical protein [Actinomycetota bacterium]
MSVLSEPDRQLEGADAAQGNPGGVDADSGPMHGMDQSALVTIPANSIVIFARDHGD